MAAPATCVHGGKAVAVLASGRYCDWCYRNAPEFLRPCTRCGADDHLNRDQLCMACRASYAIEAVFDDATFHAQPHLTALRDHLRLADARYVLLLSRRSHAWRVIVQVAALRRPITHADLDSMGTPRSVSQVRSLLVHLGILEERDEYAVALGENVLVPIREKLHRWKRPARMVWGLKDTLFPVQGAEWLDKTLPGSRGIRRVDDAKLFFPEEMPDLIAEEAVKLWGVKP